MSGKRKASIVKALRDKGFSKRAATNIAKATIRKSNAKRVCSWEQSVPAYLGIARNATNATKKLNKHAAIGKSTMAGKVIVVKSSSDKL